ncbi:AraC family transcriptional regulator [Flavobacterium sp. ENC]|uniref:AraC family transcriptional regulator n=1 Tax=Flavobacterium sp. ENC TaxID=2897330 RepID=UPI001E5CFBF8|nr:helix-turn-helix transcriptional regulator [Flavobacterium sp. ENC]MCD0465963.1 AraC family transcriptional regulator [Flavobacterium sp. ENC]
MEQRQTQRIKTISEFHRLRGLPKPEHPLISVVNYNDIVRPADIGDVNWILDFYQISLKRGINGKLKYGQQQYDFDEGIMFFISPNQVFRIEADAGISTEKSGWMLLIHPDFLWTGGLSKIIRQYDFFDYSVSEALFLSDKEETTITGIINHIRQEYHANIDKFTQSIILSHIETMLSYCERFYERQFITRKITNHKILDKLEKLLQDYYDDTSLLLSGLPTVQYIAAKLNVSPNYLSRLLKNVTGQTTQQLIQHKVIDKAKEKLATTDLSISEIAYALGFEHPQSLTKLFKVKTKQSPQEFRQSLK